MQIKIQKNIKKEKGLLIVPFFTEYEKTLPASYTPELKALIKKALKEDEFKGKLAESIYFTVDSKSLPEKITFIGCGERDKFEALSARVIGAKICTKAKKNKQTKVTVLLTPELNLYVNELTEGIALKNYRISKYKTGEENNKEKGKDLKEITFITGKPEKVIKDAKKALAISQAANIAKDLVNGPANITDADYFERVARGIGRDAGYKVTVFDKQKLMKQGWGGLLSINMGANKPAKCIILEYKGAKSSSRPIVIVGKGVIFDTGGYNLKPSRYLEGMQSDKAGASAVLGLFTALKHLKIKQNVIGILPLTENMIDGKALRPGDIITMLNKKTVEVTNTDAEGRMIVADALTHGSRLKPKYLLDIATLTGAAMAALGDRYTGVIGNDKTLTESLIKAGTDTDELTWELPLHEDHKEKMKSEIADMRNCDDGTSHLAGASKGAAFLANFIGKNKWAHLDIAGTAYTKDPKKYEQKGGTGAGVRLLLKFLEAL